MVIGVICIAVVANIYGSKMLPYWQNPIFVANILSYFAFLVPVWSNAPMTTSTHVWTQFENTGGWSSLTLAVLVGQLPAITSQTGIDAVSLSIKYDFRGYDCRIYKSISDKSRDYNSGIYNSLSYSSSTSKDN